MVVNLAGSPTLGNPHSRSGRRTSAHSRVTTTRCWPSHRGEQHRRRRSWPATGSRSTATTATTPLAGDGRQSRGDTFLTAVTLDWQAAAQPASDAGARVCVLRTAPVMDRGSAPLRSSGCSSGPGSAAGSATARQYFPMISLRDWVGAVTFLAEHDEVSGPVNLCCPADADQRRVHPAARRRAAPAGRSPVPGGGAASGSRADGAGAARLGPRGARRCSLDAGLPLRRPTTSPRWCSPRSVDRPAEARHARPATRITRQVCRPGGARPDASSPRGRQPAGGAPRCRRPAPPPRRRQPVGDLEPQPARPDQQHPGAEHLRPHAAHGQPAGGYRRSSATSAAPADEPRRVEARQRRGSPRSPGRGAPPVPAVQHGRSRAARPGSPAVRRRPGAPGRRSDPRGRRDGRVACPPAERPPVAARSGEHRREHQDGRDGDPERHPDSVAARRRTPHRGSTAETHEPQVARTGSRRTGRSAPGRLPSIR